MRQIGKNPCISVIVSVYNVQHFLSQCIESILAQTYTNLEIILVDDGSTDASGKICDDYINKDSRIKVIHQTNSGVSAARNAGLAVSTGEYIGFVDGDDWIEPQTYQTALKLMQMYHTDMVKWGKNKVAGGQINPVISDYVHKVYQGSEKSKLLSNIIKNNGIDNYIVTCLFKKSILSEFLISFPPGMNQGEDLYFLANYLLESCGTYVAMNLYFYNYRQNPTSLTKRYSDKYLKDIVAFVEQLPCLFKGKEEENLYLSSFYYRVNKLIFYLLFLLTDSDMFKIQKKVHILRQFYNRCRIPFQQAQILNNIVWTKRIPVFLFHKQHFYAALETAGLLKVGYMIVSKRRCIKKSLINFLHSHKILWKCCQILRNFGYAALLCPWVRFQQYCIHKKLSRILQRHTRKIRIGFLVTENEKWCCQSLFDKLKESPYFEPVLVLSSLTMAHPLEYLRKKFEKNRAFFQAACGNIVEAYDPQTNTFRSLKSLGLDIIFYQQPWNIAKKHRILSTAGFALPCYVPYCFEDGVTMLRLNFYHFHGFLFREYVNHPAIKQDYIRVGFPKKHIKAVGWPKLEPYLQQNTSAPKKYVIYAPHHAIEAGSIRLGTFAWNGHFMLEYAKQHPQFNWIFKPHPRCKVSFLAEGLFKNRQEMDDYYQQWAELGTTCEAGNYIDLFKQTRCLITDCSSFLVEFLPTEQPVIHLKRKDENTAANIAKQIVSAYYPVFDLDALKQTLYTVLEKGEDPMRPVRLNKLKELQLVQPAADNIIRDLQETFGVKN